ncbi:MAG: hypothetical protein RMJ15_07315 [Nitrososphaerota archaeon]|nr:hypothetical protein [Candidatus Bathyarchaeota archaeon]MDW8023525.1 hypothetical protein [Nitrososphaerota archaeon]
MERRYAHLVKPLPVSPYPGMHFSLDSKSLEGIPVNVGRGIPSRIGVAHPEGSHIHSCDELLLYFGISPYNIADLQATVAVQLGDEEHVINESSVIVIPKGLSHLPFKTLKLDKPYQLYNVLLAPEYQIQVVGHIPVANEAKHRHLIKPFKSVGVRSFSHEGPGNAEQLVYFSSRDLEGVPLSLTYGVHANAGKWTGKPGVRGHTHPYDQLLIFVGLDPKDPRNFLGAEVEIDLGLEHERYVFDKPTVVIVPKGLVHTPIVTWWVDKPFATLVINLNPEYEIMPEQ